MAEIKLNKREEKELFFKALLGSPFFNIFASVLATFMVGAVFLKFGGGVPISVTQTSVTKTSTFDVEGEGKVVVKPDVAVIQVRVVRRGNDVAELQDQVAKKMEELRQKLQELGIEKGEIKTVAYNMYQRDEDEEYELSSRLEVRVKDLAKLDEVMSLVGGLGLDGINGPSFELADETREKALSQARKEAVAKAKEKARNLAKLAGMRLGKIVNVKEQVDRYPLTVDRIDNLRTYEVRSGKNEDILEKKNVVVEPGSSEVRVKVTVSWEVE